MEAVKALDPIELTYVIGDVHGCLDELRVLLDAIEQHCASLPHRIIFLGDYIDRGPDSAGVVSLVREMTKHGDHIALCGNHEDMALIAAGDRRHSFDWWLDNGGDATLRSYGADAVPAADLDWMANLPTMAEDEHRIYVHAGVAPGTAPHKAEREVRLWIRSEFLDDTTAHGKHIVHGHTPEASEPDVQPNRTNLDTGCVYDGKLTAGVFLADRALATEWLQVRRGASDVNIWPSLDQAA